MRAPENGWETTRIMFNVGLELRVLGPYERVSMALAGAIMPNLEDEWWYTTITTNSSGSVLRIELRDTSGEPITVYPTYCWSRRGETLVDTPALYR
jgi:hypothetical protein